MKDLSVKPKTITILEENIWTNICFRQSFPGYGTNKQDPLKGNID